MRTMKSLMTAMSENLVDDSSREQNQQVIERDLQICGDTHLALNLQLRMLDQMMDEERQASGFCTTPDASAAADCQRSLVSDAIGEVDGRILSQNIDRAIVADAATILEALNEEQQEQEDRRLALSLSGLEDEIPYRPQIPQVVCSVCQDECYPAVVTKCQHSWCHSCVHNLYSLAMKDEDLVPARCCNNILEADTAKAVLNVPELQTYYAKVEERRAENPLYCPKAHCSQFLGNKAEAQERQNLRCSDCQTRVCNACGKSPHPHDVRCMPDPEAERIVTNWAHGQTQVRVKQCENCRRFIERVDGCNQMICRCGRIFCFACGLQWNSCRCRQG